MAMVVKNNMSAISTLNTLNKNSAGLSKSLAKVSSGQRVNGAADDASGYAISERMRVQVRALDQDNRNTQSGTSMMKVAEGAVSSTVDILKTLKEKVVSAANDDKTDSDRAAIQKELDQSIDQINDNANVTFNGKYLVDGSHNNAVKKGGIANTMTNESLHKETNATTSFDSMKDRNGNSLNINSDDKVTISFVKEGKTYEASVKGSDNFEALLTAANATQGKVKGHSLAADDQLITTPQQAMTGVYVAGSKETIDDFAEVVAGDINASKSSSDGHNNGVSVASGAATTSISGTLTFALGKDAGTKAATMSGSASCGSFSFAQGYSTTSSVTISDISVGTDGVIAFTATRDADGATYRGSTGAGIAGSDLKSYANTKDVNGAYKDVILGTDAADVTSLETDDKYEANDSTKLYTGKNTVMKQDNIGTSDLIGSDRSDLSVYTADHGNAITFTAANTGVKEQVAGVTIKVEDQYGVINKSANAVLDNFSESIQAQDQSADNAIVLQVGTKANQAIKVGLTDMRAEALGLRASDGTNIQIGTQKQANVAINVLDNAISKALDQQTTIGSVESRLEYTSTNLTTASENVQASESTIRDADMAKEMTEYTKNNVLLQAAQSMLAQANQNSSAVLSLLQ